MFNPFRFPRPLWAPDDDTGAGAGTPPAPEATPPAAAAAAAPAPAPAATPAPPPADDPYKWFGDELKADERSYLEAKSFKQPRDLYKSLRAAETMIRGDKVNGPPEDPEKHGDWLKETGLAKRLGIPETPADYKLEPPKFDEAIAPLVNFDEDRHGRFLGTAHKLNMTPAQVKGMLDLYTEEMGGDAKGYVEAAQADETEMTTKLSRDWGDAYDTNVRAALEAGREMGLDEKAIEGLRTGKVVGSTVLTKILYELAQARGNDSLKGGAGPGGGAPTPEAAQAALDVFMGKNGKALTNRDHPEHEAAKARLEELKRAAGRGSVGMQTA